MAIQKIGIDDFIKNRNECLVLDVRSPGEYLHAHIPNAYSLPLFTDQERKVVGTAYKQESKEKAIKIGLDYFGPKMRAMVEEVEDFVKSGNKKILVHCWRGGMRSGGVAWLLDLYGFKVYQLTGGYKAYRNWVLGQFEKPYDFKIISGNTGSGKTPLLHELEKSGMQMIDLEALAHHKGSALGGINQPPQPSQELFENLLADKLFAKKVEESILLEDESQRVGNVNIPNALWQKMKVSELIYLQIPFEERLKYLVEEYGKLPLEEIKSAILRIQKRLGGLETKNAISHLEEGNLSACFGILLRYYDKWYEKGLNSKEKGEIIKIEGESVNKEINAKKIIERIWKK
ncbi:tRNA 2-selenouridine(34) synthase MnmH [Lacihabitans soyangensis]|uniref:tRNA 2-selenouridine(34) synthase MnmH n=1 Tax=Lacihabitans soyangensis TaxID=869394 RepID=A0AAE3H0K9_9BACT|nr:tRNA 2-selenouridine(34) synthase MnmH [Lacihabitans soyangensis]MCP9761876.1 tRNA 2-selenouridine(34) synthase MnmH [Lacihabitans soyangensis]